jgi:hypothetical protein
MDQLTQADIIDMYRSQVNTMEGGRRRRVGRPRKAPVRRRGRGLVGGVLDASANVEGYISGMGLVGGRRRVGRPRGSTRPKMTAKVMEFFASKKRKKRGRGLVGGKSNQDIFDELVDSGQPIDDMTIRLLQAGIQPESAKERLIRQIRNIEKKIGVGQSSAERLGKYTKAALEKILEIYSSNRADLAYPPLKSQADIYDEERWDPPTYDFRRAERRVTPVTSASSATGQTDLG